MKKAVRGDVDAPMQPEIFLGDGDKSNQLEILFKQWQRMQDKLSENAASSEPDAQACDHALAAQTVLMRTAAVIPGANYRELLFKLALWRWDAPELATSVDQMERHEALVYSVFRDLVELTGETMVMTELDRKTKLLRDPGDSP